MSPGKHLFSYTAAQVKQEALLSQGNHTTLHVIFCQYLKYQRCTISTSTVWVKPPPPGDLTFFNFFLHKRLRICNRFFTHLLNVPIFARLQIFIQLSPISTKLGHIKCDYPVHIICAKCPKCTRSDVCISHW